MKYRKAACARLVGSGLEIGALHEATPVPAGATVRYFDAMDRESAIAAFPELDHSRLVQVDHVGDLDRRDLRKVGSASVDFVIANHVIEHVANPVAMLEDIHFICRPGGLAVIAAPDMRYTYDRERALTSFDHLWAEYEEGVETVSDEHYMDFLRHVGKHVFEDPDRRIADDIAHCRRRREHAHVWNSVTFEAFVRETIRRLGLDWTVMDCHPAEADSHEILMVLKKG
ncbi:MAG: class I SAM-dependent methyltransferase [Opitutaceae bacterium]